MLNLDSDPEVRRFLFRDPPNRHDVETETLPNIIADYERFPGFGQWAAEVLDSGEFVGWFSLYVSTPTELRRPELGYRLRRQYWGRGLASTVSVQLVDWAFAILGVDTVRAETMAVNLASRRVMSKAGLRHLRTFHVDFEDPLPGSDAGEVEYAITRDEWLGRHPRPVDPT